VRRYILRRLAQAVLVVVGVSLVVFFVIRLSGDPAFLLLSADASEADRARFVREQGFDRPIYVQYAVFVERALHGDLGRSLRYRQPALPLVLERLPATAELALAALVVSLLVAIPAGVISAVRRDTAYDNLTMLGALFGRCCTKVDLAFQRLVERLQCQFGSILFRHVPRDGVHLAVLHARAAVPQQRPVRAVSRAESILERDRREPLGRLLVRFPGRPLQVIRVDEV